MSIQVLQALAVTSELMGNEMSPPAAQMMYEDLGGYADHIVLDALHKVRREVKGRLCIADIIHRIDDGRPSDDEAWAMMPFDESQSVVWTDEMRKAFFVALPLLEVGDKVGARMAFKKSYTRDAQDAKLKRIPATWEVSLGHNASARQAIIQEAVVKGRITSERAEEVCPALMKPKLKAICEDISGSPLTVEESQRKLAEIIASIGKPKLKVVA